LMAAENQRELVQCGGFAVLTTIANTSHNDIRAAALYALQLCQPHSKISVPHATFTRSIHALMPSVL